MRLTDDQARVLEHVLTEDSDALVFAPPGAGKTTLALLCARRYTTRLSPHQKVFFLTFSNSAVDAITSRRRDLLSGHKGERIEVTNFHQFALSILRSYGPAAGLALPIHIVDNITKSYLDRTSPEDLLERGYLAFDDFLPLTNRVFQRNKSLQDVFASMYPLVIVDEFQDTNAAQWDFVSHIAEHGRLLCLADPDQMIYEFTGASPRRFEDFRAARRNHIEITLDATRNSHRFATPKILQVARCLRSGSDLPGWITDATQPVHLEVYINKAQAKAALVLFLLANAAQGCETTAILCRTNRLAEQVSRWLLDGSLGGRLARRVNHYYHLPEAGFQAIVGILRAVGTTIDAVRTDNSLLFAEGLRWWALVPSTRSSSAAVVTAEQRVWQAADQIAVNNQPSGRFRTILDNLRRTTAGVLIPQELVAAVYEQMRTTPYVGSVMRRICGEYASQIRTALAKLAHHIDEHPNVPAATHAETITIQHYAERSHGRNRRITVMTMHQSKGREYDAVVVIYPGYRNRPATDEEARVFYTAVTRARRRALLLVQREV